MQFIDHTLNCPGSTANLSGDLQYILSLLTSFQDLAFNGLGDLGPTQHLTLCFGTFQAGFHAFLNHRTFKFSEHASHLKQCLSGRCRGVHALLVQVQVHPWARWYVGLVFARLENHLQGWKYPVVQVYGCSIKQ